MKKIILSILFTSSVTIYSQTPEFHSAYGFGALGYDNSNSMIKDASNNILITGAFSSTIDFDPTAGVSNISSVGGYDGYVTKYNSTGGLIWAKKFGGTMDNFSFCVATDSQNNVYTAGQFMQTVDFDPGTAAYNLTSTMQGSFYSFDINVTKINSDGNFVWAKKIGGQGDDSVASMTVDNAGNVYVVGYFSGTADFDPGSAVYNLTGAGAAAANEAYVLKLDSNGNFLWAKSFGSTGYDRAHSVKTDSSGNVYVLGEFAGTVDFDPGAGVTQLVAAGPPDFSETFLLKLDSNGNFGWAKSFSSPAMDFPKYLTLDSMNNVIVTGAFFGTVDFDPSAATYNLTAVGANQDIFVAKFTSSGNFVWARNFGGDSQEQGTSIAIDGSDNIYVTGDFSGTCNFNLGSGTSNLTSVGGPNDTDAFILKLSSGGDFQWVKSIGGTAEQGGTSIVLDGSGGIYCTGYFTGTTNFNTEGGVFNLSSVNNSRDFFLLKLEPPLGIEENQINNIKIFPNPSNGNFSISNATALFGAKCSVFTLLGQRIQEFTLDSAEIQLSLSKGIYLLDIEKEKAHLTQKIIIE